MSAPPSSNALDQKVSSSDCWSNSNRSVASSSVGTDVEFRSNGSIADDNFAMLCRTLPSSSP